MRQQRRRRNVKCVINRSMESGGLRDISFKCIKNGRGEERRV